MRQLKEIAAEIMEKKFSGDPVKMVRELKIDLSYVRRMVGSAPHKGTGQQKTFEFTVRMLELCKELGIDPARELKKENPHLTEKGIIAHVTQHDQTTGGNVKEGQASTKKTGLSAIPTGGNPLHRRKVR